VRLDQARRVVQGDAVQVRHAHDDLKRVAEGRGGHDAHCAEKGERAPKELFVDWEKDILVDFLLTTRAKKNKGGKRARTTNHGDTLDAQHERVRGQISRVGEGVLFPELGKEILR
jgi:hypothetical protein